LEEAVCIWLCWRKGPWKEGHEMSPHLQIAFFFLTHNQQPSFGTSWGWKPEESLFRVWEKFRKFAPTTRRGKKLPYKKG
jgi:hypothetical protein